MALLSDPISGLVEAFIKKSLDSKILQRAELVFEMSIAMTICSLLATGTMLLTKQPTAMAVGAGMVSAGIAMLATFQSSPNSKGLTISIQASVAEQKMDTPTTTIARTK